MRRPTTPSNSACFLRSSRYTLVEKGEDTRVLDRKDSCCRTVTSAEAARDLRRAHSSRTRTWARHTHTTHTHTITQL